MKVELEGRHLPDHSVFSVDLKGPEIIVTGEAVLTQDRAAVQKILGRFHEKDCVKFSAEDLDLREEKGIGIFSSIRIHEAEDPRSIPRSVYSFTLKKLQ